MYYANNNKKSQSDYVTIRQIDFKTRNTTETRVAFHNDKNVNMAGRQNNQKYMYVITAPKYVK